MKSLVRLCALTLLLVPVILSAQEPQKHPLAGYWRGPMVEGGGAETEVTIELRIEGDVVTGPISTMQMGDLSIRDGSVTENAVHFTSPALNGDNSHPLVWTGQLTGDNRLAVSVVPEANDAAAIEFVLTKREATSGGGR